MEAKIKDFFDSYETVNNVENNALKEANVLFLPDYPENVLGIDYFR